MAAVFISHSGKDRAVATRIASLLRENGLNSLFLDFDPRSGIPVGRSWERELYRRLRTCRVVIVLCSQHSVRSKWCFAEITHARALERTILAVKIARCKIPPLMDGEQYIDMTDPGCMAEKLEQLVSALNGILQSREKAFWDSSRRAPFPGLKPFEKDDAAVFFGRDADVDHCIVWLNRLDRISGSRLGFLVGVSGSGKSSLVRAGILPELERHSLSWFLTAPFRPRDDPWCELDVALTRTFGKAARIIKTSDSSKSLQDTQSPAQQLIGHAHALRRNIGSADAQMLIVIDQFEELLTRSNGGSGASFLSFLNAIVSTPDGPITILATLRSDFLSELQKHPAIRHLRYETHPVNPLPVESFAELIEGPAAVADLDLEPGLVDALVSETKTEDALPLMAFALEELWQYRGTGNRLTLWQYRKKLGGLSGPIARVAEALIEADRPSEEGLEHLRVAFMNMVEIGEDGQFVRRPVPWNNLPSASHAILSRFVNARLLVSGDRGGERILEVAHEALFRAWQRLKEWLDDAVDALTTVRTLRAAAKQWSEGAEKADLLLHRGARLREADRLQSVHRHLLNPVEIDYIAACRETAKAEALRLRKESSRLVEMSLAATQRGDRQTGIVLALEALPRGLSAPERPYLAAAEAALDRAVRQGLQNPTLSGDDQITEVAFVNGAIVVFGSADGSIGVANYDLTKVRWGLFERHDAPVTGVSVSHDGALIALAWADGAISVWPALPASFQIFGHGRKLYNLGGHRDLISSVTFSRDSSQVASASYDGTIRIWSTSSGQLRNVCEGHDGPVLSVAFGCDGNSLVSASWDGTVRLWSTDSARCLEMMPTAASVPTYVCCGANSRDGVLIGALDGTIALYEGVNARQRFCVRGHNAPVTTAEFVPNAERIVTGAMDGAVRVWSARSGEMVGEIGLSGYIRSLAIRPDGQQILIGTSDGNIALRTIYPNLQALLETASLVLG